jgi:PAS domain S-box-containing protein
MTWQETPYTIPLLATAGVSVVLALYAWRHRPAAGSTPLALFMLAAAEWCLTYALELASVDLSIKMVWAKAQYFGISTAAPLVLIMVLQYTGRDRWLAPKPLMFLGIVPAIALVSAWTNEFHHLIWTETSLGSYGSFTILELEHGAGFWSFVAFSYLCLLLGTYLLVLAFRRSSPVYRAQVGVMLLGTLAPWLANAVYVSGLNPFPNLDLTPFAFTLSGLALTWGLFRFQLFDIVPIARDAVIEGMSDGVVVLDRQDRIVDINPAAERMLGRPSAVIIGKPMTRTSSAWSEALSRVLPDGVAHKEIAVVDRMGRRWHDLRISPLRHRAGRLTGRLVVIRDITQRKGVERDRELLIEELDAFAHSVAHDLKTSLTSILGFVALLRRQYAEMLDEQGQHYIRIAQRAAAKMNDIIDALLLLASVRKEEQMPVGTVDMAKVVTEVLHRLEHIIEEAKAEIVLPNSWQLAIGYGPWIEEVWTNYLSNGLKYGGNPPRLELGSKTTEDGMVRFWVCDNGDGLTEEEQAQLFTPFARLNKSESEGHGLGLSIVQRIVERLGGEVGSESSLGEGSCFTFTLPAAPESS